MKEDIKEIKQIMDDLRNGLVNGSNDELLGHAIQIQRNRMLKDALFELHPNGRGGFHHLSNLQKIAENS